LLSFCHPSKICQKKKIRSPTSTDPSKLSEGFISPTPKPKNNTKPLRASSTSSVLTPNQNILNKSQKLVPRKGSSSAFSLSTGGSAVKHKADLNGRHVLKILVVGNASCGKTSVIRRYVTDNFETEYVTTVGADYKTKSVTWDDGTEVHLQLWDIAGQDRYAQMTRPYFQGAHGALVVCDVTREESIDAVTNWKEDIDRNLQNIPVVLVANKCDLLKDGSAGMVVGGRLQDISTHMDFMSWHIISAKLDNNVTEALHTLVKSILETKRVQAKKRRQTIENFRNELPSSGMGKSTSFMGGVGPIGSVAQSQPTAASKRETCTIS